MYTHTHVYIRCDKNFCKKVGEKFGFFNFFLYIYIVDYEKEKINKFLKKEKQKTLTKFNKKYLEFYKNFLYIYNVKTKKTR